jgi:hypothetical protein
VLPPLPGDSPNWRLGQTDPLWIEKMVWLSLFEAARLELRSQIESQSCVVNPHASATIALLFAQQFQFNQLTQRAMRWPTFTFDC